MKKSILLGTCAIVLVSLVAWKEFGWLGDIMAFYLYGLVLGFAIAISFFMPSSPPRYYSTISQWEKDTEGTGKIVIVTDDANYETVLPKEK